MGEKNVVGRKRHLVVDTLGLPWARILTPAKLQDRDGGKVALTAFRQKVRLPKVIWADRAYAAVVRWALVRWPQLVHSNLTQYEERSPIRKHSRVIGNCT